MADTRRGAMIPRAVELVEGYRRKTISPVEATRAALAAIDRYNPMVNAFVLVDADGAMAAAKASEARWHSRMHSLSEVGSCSIRATIVGTGPHASSGWVKDVGEHAENARGCLAVGHLGERLGQAANDRGHFPPFLRVEARQLIKQGRRRHLLRVGHDPSLASVDSDNPASTAPARRPSRGHGTASAHAICPSKPSVFAMSR